MSADHYGDHYYWGGPMMRTASPGSAPRLRACGPAHLHSQSRRPGVDLRTNQPPRLAASDNPSDTGTLEGEV